MATEGVGFGQISSKPSYFWPHILPSKIGHVNLSFLPQFGNICRSAEPSHAHNTKLVFLSRRVKKRAAEDESDDSDSRFRKRSHGFPEISFQGPSDQQEGICSIDERPQSHGGTSITYKTIDSIGLICLPLVTFLVITASK